MAVEPGPIIYFDEEEVVIGPGSVQPFLFYYIYIIYMLALEVEDVQVGQHKLYKKI
jgi:hypothetical protein